MKEYRILEEKYYDRYGKETNCYYIVQYRKQFLGIRYWKTVRHKMAASGGVYSSVTHFPSEAAAREFAERYGCGELPHDGWVTRVIGHNKCEQLKQK